MTFNQLVKSEKLSTVAVISCCVFIIVTSFLTINISSSLFSSSASAQSAEELIVEIDEYWFQCKNIAEEIKVNGFEEREKLESLVESANKRFERIASEGGVNSSRVSKILALSKNLLVDDSRTTMKAIEDNLVSLRKEEVGLFREAINSWNDRASMLTYFILGIQILVFLLMVMSVLVITRYFDEKRKTIQAKGELARLVETSHESIFSLAKDGSILSWNEGSERMFGYSNDEVSGLDFQCLFATGSDIPAENLLAKLSMKTVREIHLKKKDGTTFFAAVSFSPVLDSKGSIESMTVVSRDVSEQVIIRSEQADFIASLTHDLKNPLIANNQVLTLVKEEDLTNSKKLHLLEKVINSNQDLIEMFSSMLELYKINSGAFQPNVMPVDFGSLIKLVTESHSHQAEASAITLVIRLDSPNTKFVADPLLVRKILSNLIDNAIKHSKSGSSVLVSFATDNERIKISVEDEGSGVSPKDTQKLFTFSGYSKDKSRPGGSSIGLYLAQKLAQIQQGSLSYAAREPRGSTFELSLPANPYTEDERNSLPSPSIQLKNDSIDTKV